MANTPGAKKAVRKIARRTEVNKARRSRVRTYLRKFEEALAAGDPRDHGLWGHDLPGFTHVPFNDLAAMGDDYELLFAAPASARTDVAAAAAAARTPVSRIGALCPGADLLLDGARPARLGYQHR